LGKVVLLNIPMVNTRRTPVVMSDHVSTRGRDHRISHIIEIRRIALTRGIVIVGLIWRHRWLVNEDIRSKDILITQKVGVANNR